MATITIEVPDSEDDIPTALRKLRAQLAPINAQRDALLAAIRSVQQRCPHKNAYRGRDISGGPDGHCRDCDYSW